jgi:hypothetical protein
MQLTQTDVMEANPELIGELHALMDRNDIENPTREDRRAFREFIQENPQLWIYAGNVVEQAAYSLVDSIGGKGTMLTAALKKGFTQMPRDLALPTDGPLEQLLVQQVVLCWMRYGQVEYTYTTKMSSATTFQQLRYWEQRLNAAQRRYLRAVETLARVRKLQLPAMQINIASQQVNQVNTKC